MVPCMRAMMRLCPGSDISRYPGLQGRWGKLFGNITHCIQEYEVSWISDIGHWTFECPMPNIEYPANFTFLHPWSIWSRRVGPVKLALWHLLILLNIEKRSDISHVCTRMPVSYRVSNKKIWMTCWNYSYGFVLPLKYFSLGVKLCWYSECRKCWHGVDVCMLMCA